MRLKIRGTMLVSEVKEKFNECFPLLSLQFYPSHKAIKSGLPYSDDHLMDNIIKKMATDEIEIMSWHKAEHVILKFKDEFGLLVKIFRLANNEPIELNDDEILVEGSEQPNKSSIIS